MSDHTARRRELPEVTQATLFSHPTGDNPVDAVDNSEPPSALGNADDPAQPAERAIAKPPNEIPGSTTASNTDGDGGTNGNDSDEPATGRDMARAALAAAREKADARSRAPSARARGKPASESGSRQHPRRRRWAGPGADERDPQPIGRLVSRISAERGWHERLAHGRVFGSWARLVGAEVAEHAEPVSLREGELTVRASSTAWATQLRLLQRQLLGKIAAGVGHGVVTRMRINGPAAPSWRKGVRHIPGRGPRDTYG